MSEKPINKETLQVELNSLLTTAHGDIKDAAQQIATALDAFIQDKNQKNKEMFIAAVTGAMAVPKSTHFNVADQQVKKALMEILEHAQAFIHSGLQDVIAFNEKIKQEKKKLKERIEQVEDEKRQFRR